MTGRRQYPKRMREPPKQCTQCPVVPCHWSLARTPYSQPQLPPFSGQFPSRWLPSSTRWWRNHSRCCTDHPRHSPRTSPTHLCRAWGAIWWTICPPTSASAALPTLQYLPQCTHPPQHKVPLTLPRNNFSKSKAMIKFGVYRGAWTHIF